MWVYYHHTFIFVYIIIHRCWYLSFCFVINVPNFIVIIFSTFTDFITPHYTSKSKQNCVCVTIHCCCNVFPKLGSVSGGIHTLAQSQVSCWRGHASVNWARCLQSRQSPPKMAAPIAAQRPTPAAKRPPNFDSSSLRTCTWRFPHRCSVSTWVVAPSFAASCPRKAEGRTSSRGTKMDASCPTRAEAPAKLWLSTVWDGKTVACISALWGAPKVIPHKRLPNFNWAVNTPPSYYFGITFHYYKWIKYVKYSIYFRKVYVVSLANLLFVSAELIRVYSRFIIPSMFLPTIECNASNHIRLA